MPFYRITERDPHQTRQTQRSLERWEVVDPVQLIDSNTGTNHFSAAGTELCHHNLALAAE